MRHAPTRLTDENFDSTKNKTRFTPKYMRLNDLGSASRLAGAMGLEGSYQLHRLLSKTCPATQRVIADFVKDRQNDFGHAHLPKNLRIVQAHNITNAVDHAGEFVFEKWTR
jgi:hypothetical protein